MRLQSALSMDEFEGLEAEEMGLFRSREEREERRARRKARRRRRRGAGRPQRGRRAVQPALQPAPQGPPALQPAPQWPEADYAPTPQWPEADYAPTPQWPEADYAPMEPEVLDAEVLDESDLEDLEDTMELEGVGALARRWSPLVRMGRNFRIQAAEGYRAAVVPLKPGLFLVAELPEHVARSEFGIAPLLAPLVVRAASRAISQPPAQGQRPGRALLQRALRAQQARPGQGQGRAMLQRFLARRQAAMPAAAPTSTALVPAPGSGHGQARLLPAPSLGAWVDPEDLAGLLGDGEGA